MLAVLLLLAACTTSTLPPPPEPKPVPPPQMSEEARTQREAELAKARADYDKNPNDADAIIWLGRRTAYLGRYHDAIAIFTEGIRKHPNDARMYRHRGHRYITIRELDRAIADFARAEKLVRGKPDEIEPDGLPNARNTPIGSLQSNICYHHGLAYYLKGDFERALAVYRPCHAQSTNPDRLVSTAHWLYMTLRRLGREREAAATLTAVRDGLDVVENADYYKLVRLYQGKLGPAGLLGGGGEKDADTLSNATVGYGVGNWHLYNGRREEALKIFRRVTAGSQWASFGYIAAEAELK